MKHLHYLFTLRHPRRFWCSALVIAVSSILAARLFRLLTKEDV